MKYVLAEINRRNISFHYYNGENGNRAFVPYGSNGPIPLAISYLNNRYSIGIAAQSAVEEGQKEAYNNLFDVTRMEKCCDGLRDRQLVPKVITILLEDLCRDKFNSNLDITAPQMTLILLYGNDVGVENIECVEQELSKIPFAEIKVYDQSVEAIKFFCNSTIYDWSGETDAMVVLSDNQDLSVSCYSLTDYSLKYSHRYKEQGKDPRLEWATEKLWRDVTNHTWCTKEECLPVIRKAIERFLASNNQELTSIKLPDGEECQVLMSKNTYYAYSPSGGNQFMTIAGDVVKKAGLKYETTGIILQGYAANNKFFRESFISFDPISDNTEAISKEIRNYILRNILGVAEALEIDKDYVEIPCEGGTIKVDVKSSPTGVMYKASCQESWVELMLGINSIGIDVKKNESSEKRKGEIVVTSAYGNINKVLKVVQLGEAISSGLPPIGPDDDGKRKFNMSYTLSNEKRKQFLTVEVEVLDDKALPFDCMFTIDNKNFMSYKPDESFCEECKRGQKGILKFGPYELPIPGMGTGKILYAHIWPADKTIMPNVFRKNHLKIQL